METCRDCGVQGSDDHMEMFHVCKPAVIISRLRARVKELEAKNKELQEYYERKQGEVERSWP